MNKFAECPIEKRQTATFAACRRCGVISGPDDWLRPCNLAPRASGVPVAIFQRRVGLDEVRDEIFRGSGEMEFGCGFTLVPVVLLSAPRR
jgi:hypothetical protein